MREKKKKMKRRRKKRISSLFKLPQMMRQMLFHKGKRKKLEVRGKFQKEEGEDPDNDTCSDEEVRMPTKKEPFVKQRKSIRLASSVLWLV